MLHELISKHKFNGLLIDTNLLLLLVVGLYDRRRIESFKRTATYTQGDFQKLGWLMHQFNHLWTTPNILTEVDNLGRQLPSREWPGFAKSLTEIGLRTREVSVTSSSAMNSPFFKRLGLADSATLMVKESFLLISDDLSLYLEALRHKIDAVNFNHLRQ